ncbi:MAG TPA: lipoyl synthase [Planctomycetota bacterium]|nr:lipoyl synthase [Planctomycetota bacterium]
MNATFTRRIPEWIRTRPPGGPEYARLKALLGELNLATVCEEAHCPNVHECWGGGTATVMLLGRTCTRGCRFCAVQTAQKGDAVDPDEPEKLAYAISQLGLTYVVVTMVDRDDLPDGGSSQVARAIAELRRRSPELLVEVLVSDFRGDRDQVSTVARARPDVFAHNIEVVERLQPNVRDARCGYRQSLDVLATAKKVAPEVVTKSSIMLGLGETEAEVVQAMRDLRASGVEVLTLGQYLRPSPWHLPVAEWIEPRRFDEYREIGLREGFAYVASGPLVRSSYRAGEFFLESHLRDKKRKG